MRVFVLVIMFLSRAICWADKWDPFLNLEHATVESTEIEEDTLANDGFVDTQWKVFWQEDKDLFTITVSFPPEDLLSMLRVSVADQQIVLKLEKKMQIIRVPASGNLDLMTHRIDGEQIKINIPKKKLKSII